MSEIEKELKLSKKQNKNDRYNYLCSQFNGIEYAMKLEKYANKLIKENKKLQQRNHDLLITKTEKMDIIMNQSSVIEQLQQDNESMKKLIEWISECDFGFDNFVNDYEEDINMTEEEFDKETENMSYIESMIHYAKLYIKTKGE